MDEAAAGGGGGVGSCIRTHTLSCDGRQNGTRSALRRYKLAELGEPSTGPVVTGRKSTGLRACWSGQLDGSLSTCT